MMCTCIKIHVRIHTCTNSSIQTHRNKHTFIDSTSNPECSTEQCMYTCNHGCVSMCAAVARFVVSNSSIGTCVCVCVFVWCLRVRVLMHASVYMYVCRYVYVCTYIYHMHADTRMLTHKHTRSHAGKYARMRAYIHAKMHTNIHACICVCFMESACINTSYNIHMTRMHTQHLRRASIPRNH